MKTVLDDYIEHIEVMAKGEQPVPIRSVLVEFVYGGAATVRSFGTGDDWSLGPEALANILAASTMITTIAARAAAFKAN